MVSAPVIVPPSDAEQIRELSRMLQLGNPALLGPQNERIELPESVYHVLKDVVRYMKAGRAITLVPQKQQLTTQSAANMLGCSRPHVIKLLETGAIPFQKVGQHRRVLLKDILDFQKSGTLSVVSPSTSWLKQSSSKDCTREPQFQNKEATSEI